MQAVTTVRTIAGARALTGRADRLTGHAGGGVVARVLGARQLVQAVVIERTGWHALSAGVDLLHGASMLALLPSRRWRRFGATQALTAVLLIALEVRAGRR